MSEEVKEKEERKLVGKVCGCNLYTFTDSEDVTHFESECKNLEARAALAKVFGQEAILRVNPKVVLDDPDVAVPFSERLQNIVDRNKAKQEEEQEQT
ncbi:hypothetical protein ES703_109968 [subsurface metagenome]